MCYAITDKEKEAIEEWRLSLKSDFRNQRKEDYNASYS